MADASYVRGDSDYRVTLAAAASAGEVRQLSNGLAAVMQGLNAAASGDQRSFKTEGQFTLTKTSGVVLLDGGRAYWDHSANAVTFRKVNDRDFYVGRVVGDAASTDTQCVVNLNVDPAYDVDIHRDPIATVHVGTQGLNTMGVFQRGGAHKFLMSTTSEAQKMDVLSVDGFSKDANWIVEGAFRVVNDGAGTAADFNIGLANGTNATDADSITESVFIHLDANNTAINAESDDNTTEVAATNTTLTYTEGSAVANRVEFWMDGRNPADVQIYVNGVLVLPSSVFNVNAATGPLFLLAHLEKTSAADAYEIDVDWLRVRLMEQ
jgi:predicted RecA/RadA family phage recombinase